MGGRGDKFGMEMLTVSLLKEDILKGVVALSPNTGITRVVEEIESFKLWVTE